MKDARRARIVAQVAQEGGRPLPLVGELQAQRPLERVHQRERMRAEQMQAEGNIAIGVCGRAG